MTNAADVSLDGMNAAGFFDANGGSARLLKRDELPDKWETSAEGSTTVWEACQHLIEPSSAFRLCRLVVYRSESGQRGCVNACYE